MKQKSISFNSFIFSIKSILTVLFPLITYPYALRVLGVNNMGRYNFINSIIGYFLLLGSLGIVSYARRDGAIIRNDKKELSRFASEVFSCNMILTVISYIILISCIFSFEKIRNEYILALVLSLAMFLTVFGVEWIYSVYEDYIYITIRQIAMQMVSMVMLFLLVHDSDDLILYSIISITACAGGNIFNFVHSRKYCNIVFTFKCNFRKHLPKTLVFFANAMMITIYTNTDQTMLGFMCGDYNVGLYGTAVKIYHVLCSVLTSASIVGVTTLTNFIGNNKVEAYNRLASHIFSIIVTLTFPFVTGGTIFAHEIISLFGGIEYIEAVNSLIILIIGLLGYVMAVFWGQCVLVASGREKCLFYITTVSAVINLIGNFILIPYFRQDAAAFTTLLSEAITALLTWRMGRKLVKINSGAQVVVQSFIGGIFVIVVSLAFKHWINKGTIALFSSIIVAGVGYFCIEFLIGNPFVKGMALKAIMIFRGKLGREQ